MTIMAHLLCIKQLMKELVLEYLMNEEDINALSEISSTSTHHSS